VVLRAAGRPADFGLSLVSGWVIGVRSERGPLGGSRDAGGRNGFTSVELHCREPRSLTDDRLEPGRGSHARNGSGPLGATRLRNSQRPSMRMLEKPLTIATLVAGASYLAYRYWSTYPSLIPSPRGVREIDRIARRQGISTQAAYRRWAEGRLRYTRYHGLLRNSAQR